MLLITHIIIALSSLVFTTLMYFAPSKTKITASYGLVAATLVTGTALVISNKGHLLEACTVGLVYVAIVTVGIIATQNKLAKRNI